MATQTQMMDTKSSNTVQTFWVLLGSVSAFGFSIISSMLLSRYFDKQDYGTYKQVMYVYGTLLVVFTLGLPRAFSYFLPRVDKSQAKDLISKINLVLSGLGGLMSLVLFFGANLIASFLDNSDLAESIRYFALVPFFMLPTMGLDGILSTFRQTMFLAIYNTISKVFMLLCVVVPVMYFNGNVNSAIIGFTVSSFLCFVVALLLKYKPLKGYIKERCPITYKEIFNYTLPLMGASIWGIIIASSDQFFISRYFGNEVFADFANGSLELPFVGMIIASTSTVLSPVFSKHVHEKGADARQDVLELWQSVLSKTVKLIYPLVVFCFCFADVIMVLLFGEKYHDSGAYFQIKVTVNFFTVIAYAPLMLSIGGQRYYYRVHMLGAIILVVLEWLAASVIQSSYMVTSVSVFCQIGRVLAILYYLVGFFKIKWIDLFPVKLVLNIIIPSFLMLFLFRYTLAYLFEINEILIMVISFVLYLLSFGAWVFYKKINYVSIITPLILKIKR